VLRKNLQGLGLPLPPNPHLCRRLARVATEAQRLQVRPLQPRATIRKGDNVVYHLRRVDLAVSAHRLLGSDHAG